METEVETHEELRATLRLAPKRLISHSVNSFSDSKEKWREEEVKALAEFILFHTPGDKWPSHKQSIFWASASKFVKHRVKSPSVCRSGMLQYYSVETNAQSMSSLAEACRCKVTGNLAKR